MKIRSLTCWQSYPSCLRDKALKETLARTAFFLSTHPFSPTTTHFFIFHPALQTACWLQTGSGYSESSFTCSIACASRYKPSLPESQDRNGQLSKPVKCGMSGEVMYSVSSLGPQFHNWVDVNRKVLLYGKPAPAFPYSHPQWCWCFLIRVILHQWVSFSPHCTSLHWNYRVELLNWSTIKELQDKTLTQSSTKLHKTLSHHLL